MLRKGTPSILNTVVDGFRNSSNSCSSSKRTHTCHLTLVELMQQKDQQTMNIYKESTKLNVVKEERVTILMIPTFPLNIKEPCPNKKTKRKKNGDDENINIPCKGPPKTIHTNFSGLNVSWQMSTINEELQKIYPGLKHETTCGNEEITRSKRGKNHRHYKERIQQHPVEFSSNKEAKHLDLSLNNDSGSFTYIESPIQSLKKNVCNSVKEKLIWTITGTDMDTNVCNSIKEKQIWTVTDNDTDTIDEYEFYEMRKNNMASMKALRICCFIIVMAIFSAIIAFLSLYIKKFIEDEKLKPNRNPSFLLGDRGETHIVGNLGSQICLSPESFYANSSQSEILTGVTIFRNSSRYFKYTKKQNLIVSFKNDEFNEEKNGWVVDYNVSRNEQPLKIGILKMTCEDAGNYTVTLEYEGTHNETYDVYLDSSYPNLKLDVDNEDKSYINITCELTDVCSEAPLSIFIHDGDSTHSLRGDNTSCDLGTTILKRELTIPKTSKVPVYNISCKPLTHDGELNNLTKSVELCDVPKNLTTCEKEHNGHFFLHPVLCNMYYHCDSPTLLLRPCGNGTEWNPTRCTCDFEGSATTSCKYYSKITSLCNFPLNESQGCPTLEE